MAAAGSADPAVVASTCPHCQREVPSSNIALHSAHCARHLQKCELCGDLIPRKHMNEHFDENHAPVNCSLCKGTIERELWDLHAGIQCPQRMLACQYCEYELPMVDLLEHQDVCGNRTEYCQPCGKYIRLKEWIGHGIQFHANPKVPAESSSSDITSMGKEERTPMGKEERTPTEEHRGSERKQLILTIAITGIAILIGLILFSKKGMAR